MLICDLNILRLTLIGVPHREQVLFQLERPIVESNIRGEKLKIFLVKILRNSRKQCVRKIFIFRVKPKGINLLTTGRQSVNLER
jgi:hypothetical protein